MSSAFSKNISYHISDYIADLLKDFSLHQSYVQAFNKVFLKGYSLKTLIVENKKITDFQNWDLNGSIPYDSVTSSLEVLEKNDIDLNVLSEFSSNELYFFFEKREFNSLIEAEQSFSSGYYYVNIKELSHKIDKIFLDRFTDYQKVSDDIYEKKIDLTCSFLFSRKRENTYLNIEDYVFPDFIVRLHGMDFKILRETDVHSLLFMPSSSFNEFYSYYNKCDLNDRLQIINVRVLNDEPIILYNRLSNKYVVSNTPEKIKYFNTLIYLTLELTVHYFRVFEKWLINVLKG